MKNVRETANEQNIGYYPVIFTPVLINTNVENYVRSFEFDTCFYWSAAANEQNLLVNAVTPTHVLVDREGTIIQVWFGSNQDKEVRSVMSEQISSDLRLIKDVAEAIKQ